MNSRLSQQAYDELAPAYDAEFTHSVVGTLQREAVWRWVGRLYTRGNRVLDLGCGTGEDAMHFVRQGVRVHGIDVSPEMIGEARKRVATAGFEDQIQLEALPIERLDEIKTAPFDGAFSNFGALNCVRDLRATAGSLARLVRPGGWAAFCLMSKRCLWETLLFPLTRRIHRNLGREDNGWEEGPTEDFDFPVFYPSVSRVTADFAPWFRLTAAPGIALFVPPTYLEPWAQQHPRRMRALASLDRLVAHWPLIRKLADHRLLLMERTPVEA